MNWKLQQIDESPVLKTKVLQGRINLNKIVCIEIHLCIFIKTALCPLWAPTGYSCTFIIHEPCRAKQQICSTELGEKGRRYNRTYEHKKEKSTSIQYQMLDLLSMDCIFMTFVYTKTKFPPYKTTLNFVSFYNIPCWGFHSIKALLFSLTDSQNLFSSIFLQVLSVECICCLALHSSWIMKI